MSNANFLAIDEPSLGLLPYLRTEVFHRISEVNKGGITALMVEQNVAEYVREVRGGKFLTREHCYKMKNGEIEKLGEILKRGNK